MPKLNEYLGSIVSGITDARMMSDIQTLRVAQEYAKHPLLQYFSAARMRIDQVKLTIPVALESISERKELVFERVDNKKFRTRVRDLFFKGFDLSRLREDHQKLFDQEIAQRVKQLDAELALVKSPEPVKPFTQALSSFLVERSGEFGIEKNFARRGFDRDKITGEIHDTLAGEIKAVSETKVIDGLNVTVEADKLREKKPESLVFIEMTISEEGMEWHKIETGGKVETKLLPE